jgi:glycosyltransferase involved in cell wall biosynthesis
MSGIDLMLVSAHPPSRSSLTEYGFHLAGALRRHPGVGSLTVLSDELEEGVYPLGVEAGWGLDRMGNPFRLVARIRRRRPQAVIFNLQNASFGRHPVPAALGLATPALCRLAGVPSVVILHNLADMIAPDQVGFGGNRLWRLAYRLGGRSLTWLLLRANLVTVTVPRYVEFLAGRYRAGNIEHVPHGSFGPVVRDPGVPDVVRLLAFGKFGTYKRVEVLLEAAEILAARGVELEVVVAGTDNPNATGYLQGVAERFSHLTNVRFTGYVEEEDLPALFASSWAVVMPYTSTTGASGVLHQAGEYSRAVIMPAIGDFLDLMREQGFEGEPFQPDDADSLAGAVQRLIDEPDRHRAIGEANRRAAGAVSMDDVAESLVNLVTRATNGPGRRAGSG